MSFAFFFHLSLLVATETNQNEQCAAKKTGLIEDHSWNIPGKVWSSYLQWLSI